MLDRIRHTMPSSASLAIALALVALFAALGGVALGTSSNGKTVSRTRTVIVSPDSTGTQHVLFTIGQATLYYSCFSNAIDGNTTVGVGVTAGPNGADVGIDDGPPGGQLLGPNESGDPFLGPAAYGDRGERGFGVYDKAGTAATGSASAFVQSAAGSCVITAQAAG